MRPSGPAPSPAPDHGGATSQALEVEELAVEILKHARDTLLVCLRFLEPAIHALEPRRSIITTTGLATDGRLLHYDPARVCRGFQRSPRAPARDLLHVILHCLFRHPLVSPKASLDHWDLACDAAVENVIDGLSLERLRDDRSDRQKALLSTLSSGGTKLTAEWIYRRLLDDGVAAEECARLRAPFMVDDHLLWRQAQAKKEPLNQAEKGGASDEPDTGDEEPATLEDEAGGEDSTEPPDDAEANGADEADEAAAVKGDPEEGSGAERGSEESDDKPKPPAPALTPEELERLWREIAERVEVDLETFSTSWGDSAGELTQSLKELTRDKLDYAALLRRFAVLGESVEVNDEEFDQVFYTYGLSIYGRMPLVEPLEYKEAKRIREFVIAIDTSESVAGDQVQAFVTKTWNILKTTGSFFTRVNVHIIQCGARVEEDARITTQEEFDAYIRTMVLKGFGGTDYRPVFERVETLIRQKELVNLKGLIYFTDGYGTFPSRPPSFDTVFVFLDQGRDIPETPVWAARLLMTPDDLEYLR